MLLNHSCQEPQSKPQSKTTFSLLCAGVLNHHDFPQTVISKLEANYRFRKTLLSLTHPHQKSIHPELIESPQKKHWWVLKEQAGVPSVGTQLRKWNENKKETLVLEIIKSSSIGAPKSIRIFLMLLNASNRIQESCWKWKDQFVCVFVMGYEG